MVESGTRNADAAGFGDALQSRGDVDAVAENVVALDQYIAEIDADAIEDARASVSSLRPE